MGKRGRWGEFCPDYTFVLTAIALIIKAMTLKHGVCIVRLFYIFFLRFWLVSPPFSFCSLLSNLGRELRTNLFVSYSDPVKETLP